MKYQKHIKKYIFFTLFIFLSNCSATMEESNNITNKRVADEKFISELESYVQNSDNRAVCSVFINSFDGSNSFKVAATELAKRGVPGCPRPSGGHRMVPGVDYDVDGQNNFFNTSVYFDEFDGSRTVKTSAIDVTGENPGSVMVALASKKTTKETINFIQILSSYRGSWKFFYRSAAIGGIEPRFVLIDRHPDCSKQKGIKDCQLSEVFNLIFSSGDFEKFAIEGLRVKIYARRGNNLVIEIPAQAFAEVIFRATAEETGGNESQ